MMRKMEMTRPLGPASGGQVILRLGAHLDMMSPKKYTARMVCKTPRVAEEITEPHQLAHQRQNGDRGTYCA